jgi:hypothetical protein
MLLYATRGVMRQLQNLRDGRKPAYGAGDEMDWQIHIEGSAWWTFAPPQSTATV